MPFFNEEYPPSSPYPTTIDDLLAFVQAHVVYELEYGGVPWELVEVIDEEYNPYNFGTRAFRFKYTSPGQPDSHRYLMYIPPVFTPNPGDPEWQINAGKLAFLVFASTESRFFAPIAEGIRLASIRFEGSGPQSTCVIEDLGGSSWQLTLTKWGPWNDTTPSWYVQTYSEPYTDAGGGGGGGPEQLEAIPHYTALFRDAAGTPGRSYFSAGSDAAAKAIGQSIAALSEARWIGLRRILPIAVQNTDEAGPLYASNFAGAPAAGATVQRRGVFRYGTAVPRDFIRLDLPAVKSSYLNRGARETSSDALSGFTRPLLRSEAGAPAASLQHARYTERMRR